MSISPFLKWAGGKRWLTSKHAEFFPAKYNLYIEPFLGGGAVFFHLRPNEALLGDKNADLINVYKVIKTNWSELISQLAIHQKNHSVEYYYKIRDYSPGSDLENAAKFIYLNRTCWNGLYRVNLKGRFNVPIGTKTEVLSEDDDFESVSHLLKNAVILSEDFEVLVGKAEKNDLVFVDPPYTVAHGSNGFLKYNESLFSWEDQERLAECLRAAKKRGAKVIATNADHDSVEKLYKGDFSIVKVSRQSVISGKAESRKKYTELVIRSF